MLHYNTHITTVTSTYELLSASNTACLRLNDQASALMLVVNSTDQIIGPKLQVGEQAIIALSEQLCGHLLPLSRRERALKTPDIIVQMINSTGSDVVWLDRIQILFEPSLELDPLRQLQELARLKPIIAIWPGQITKQFLTFSNPGKSDYQSYSLNELANVSIIHFVEQREYK